METNISGFVCCLVAALLFANTWKGDFVYDDSRAIVSNEDLRPSSSWMDLWRHDFWGTRLEHAGSHQSWRPLCVLSFRLNYFWSGLNPKSYHVVNVILHSLVTLCLTLLVQPIIRRRWIRWIVSLAFAVHPIHCEAVASIVGRAELGAALHTLVALLAYRAHLKARGRRRSRYQANKEATSNTKEDRRQQQEEEEEEKGDEERQRIGKKTKKNRVFDGIDDSSAPESFREPTKPTVAIHPSGHHLLLLVASPQENPISSHVANVRV